MAFNFFGDSNMSNLFQDIRQLCAKHGYRAVQEGITTVIQEDYFVLKGLVEGCSLGHNPTFGEGCGQGHNLTFGEGGGQGHNLTFGEGGGHGKSQILVDETIDFHIPFVNQQTTQKKQVKKANKTKEPEYAEAAETFAEDMIDGLVDTSKLGTIKAGTDGVLHEGHLAAMPNVWNARHSKLVGAEIVVNKLGNKEEPEVKPTFFTVAEEKAWQKEEEAKTRQKLDATGIKPESLLTQENLEQWILKEKKGYAYVARRHVGLSESAVQAACKEFGIVSDAAKRRQAIVASRVNAMRGRGRGR
jgi:hypothetical protein